MKQEHTVLNKLRKIAPARFRYLKYCPGKGGYMVDIRQRGYQNLLSTISGLLKSCVVATEEAPEICSDISRPHLGVNKHWELFINCCPCTKVIV